MSNTYSGAGAPAAAGTFTQSAPRPKALGVAILAAGGAVLMAAVAAIMIFAGGKEALAPVVADLAADVLGTTVTEGAFFDIVLDEAYARFSARASIYLFMAATTLVFLLLALKAKTWARVLLTLALISDIGYGALNALDVGTTAHTALSFAVVILSLVALVVFWAPSVNRYAKANRKRA